MPVVTLSSTTQGTGTIATARGPDPSNPLYPAGQLPANPNLPAGVDPVKPVMYDELADYKESWDGKCVQATRLLQCDWSMYQALMMAMLPTAKIGAPTGEVLQFSPWNGSNINTPYNPAYPYVSDVRVNLIRYQPEVHPRYSYMYAVEAHLVEGVGYPGLDGGPAKLLTFYVQNGGQPNPPIGKARVAVTYRTLPYTVNISDVAANAPGASELMRYVYCVPKPAGQNLPIAGTVMCEGDSGGAAGLARIIPEAAPRVLPSIHLAYHWMMVPALPAACYFMMGCCNEFKFDPANPIFDQITTQGSGNIGEVQYLHPELSEPYYTFHGDLVYDIVQHMVFRHPGWNWFFRPGPPFRWIQAYRPGGLYVTSIQSGGAGYAVGDTITLTGGTFTKAGILLVTTVNAGAVTGVSVVTSGVYTVVPANPVAQGTSSGAGAGAAFNCTMNGIPAGLDPTAYALAPGVTQIIAAGYNAFNFCDLSHLFKLT